MAKYRITPSSKAIIQLPISIGHKAEKGVEAIEFDLTAWVETYGSGTLTVIMRRWGDAIPYPIALEIDENNKATWTLSDIDTAKAGMAYAQLSYVVGETVVKKSDIYTFRVMDSLTGEGEPPEAYESWLEQLTHLAAEAMAEVLDIEGIVTDKTLTVDGGIADAKATGDALALKADKSTTYTKTEVDTLIESVDVETDTTLSVSGKPADAKKTGDELSALKADLGDMVPGLSQDARAALLTCLGHVAWTDGHGRTYYNALEGALYPDIGLVNITAVFTQGSAVIYQTTPLNDLKGYLVVTGHYDNGTSKVITDYSLSGTLTVGTSMVTVNANGKITTFTVTVSSPYWDYEWYATSGTLPEGMTADAYDFSTVPGALHVEKPVMDFDYIGDIRLYIECSLYAVNAETGTEWRLSNPQIVIKNKVVSENQFKGCKVIASPPQTSTFYVGFGVNGTTTIIPEIASMDIHAYDISAINGVYSLTIDGTEISITQNDNTTQYINFTGINSTDGAQSLQIMNIKCIKYKKL